MAIYNSTGYIDYKTGYIVAGADNSANSWTSKTSWLSMTWGNSYSNPMTFYTTPVDVGSISKYNLSIDSKANGTITYTVLQSSTSSFATTYDRDPKTVTTAGSVSTSTTKKYGNYGISILGNNTSTATISTPYSSDFDFGTGVFTIEAWINGTFWDSGVLSNQRTIFAHTTQGTGGTDRLEFYVNSGILTVKLGTTTALGGTLSTSTWYHVALSRDSGGVVRLFTNGYCDQSYTNAQNVNTTATVYIGRTSSGIENSTSSIFWGYLDDVRVSNTCRYTGTMFTQVFTPPAATLVNDASTILLMTGERGVVDTPNILTEVTSTTIVDGDSGVPAFTKQYAMVGITVDSAERPTIYSSKITPNTRRLDILLNDVDTTTLSASTTTSTSKVLDLGREVSGVLAINVMKTSGLEDVGIVPVVANKTEPAIAWVKATEGSQDYVYGGTAGAAVDPATLSNPTIDVVVHALPEQFMENGILQTR
jgi:hypothetical protein